MLTALSIENFAIVSKLELDFASGMTVFTGETGAGKSIMIDALMLALGERTDVQVIRPGAEKCTISACFQLEPNTPPAMWLLEHDIHFDEMEVYLRRVISIEGRSKCYINGEPFPLQKVKEFSALLVDIHGQHQHQTLLLHPTHRVLLDNYGKHQAICQNVRAMYEKLQAIEAEKSKIEKAHAQNSLEHLQVELEAFAALDLKEDELASLNQEHQMLQHACDYLTQVQAMVTLLEGEEGHASILKQLHQLLQMLSSFPQDVKPVQMIAELLNTALVQCEEAFHEVKDFAAKITLDPSRLYEVEARLSELHQLARKYHIDMHQLPEHYAALQAQQLALENDLERARTLEIEYQNALATYDELAHNLTLQRQASAEKLAQEISATIQQLGMPHGQFYIDISPLGKPQAHGADKVEFKVCTNPGMLPDSLSKVASGGELSRISLAIHLLTAERGATPTLLFDEVDVGIGGATAALVGRMLRKLGARLQVFCVTHQPQVASFANHHYIVEKFTKDAHTFSKITVLNSREKESEIARMLGGLSITEQTLSHAREMLASAVTE